MSRLDRALGLARSLAIYHAIPLRQKRMRQLYAGFVGSGDLVFDIGAHAGNRVRGFASLGCRVVAVEPQPGFSRLFRGVFGRSSRVAVIPAAACAALGTAALLASEPPPPGTPPPEA